MKRDCLTPPLSELLELLKQVLSHYGRWIRSTISSTACRADSANPRQRLAVTSLTESARQAEYLSASIGGALAIFRGDRAVAEDDFLCADDSGWSDADYQLSLNACLVYLDYLEALRCVSELTGTDPGSTDEIEVELYGLGWLRAYLAQAAQARALLKDLDEGASASKCTIMALLANRPVEPFFESSRERTLVL
jgi:hypothetical protein